MQVLALCLTQVEERTAVVIGGGRVAQRKTKTLLEAGLGVRLIAPQVRPEIRAIAARFPAPQFEIQVRAYRPGDLAGAFLAFAATDQPAINRQVVQEARQLGCLVNAADDPASSDFFSPAVIRHGDLTVSVSTGGKSPAVAGWLRRKIEAELLPQADELAGLLAEARTRLDGIEVDLDLLLAAGVLDTLHGQGKDAALIHLLETVHGR